MWNIPSLPILGLVWFLCLMAYQLFLGYIMPKHSPRTVVVLFNL